MTTVRKVCFAVGKVGKEDIAGMRKEGIGPQPKTRLGMDIPEAARRIVRTVFDAVAEEQGLKQRCSPGLPIHLSAEDAEKITGGGGILEARLELATVMVLPPEVVAAAVGDTETFLTRLAGLKVGKKATALDILSDRRAEEILTIWEGPFPSGTVLEGLKTLAANAWTLARPWSGMTLTPPEQEGLAFPPIPAASISEVVTAPLLVAAAAITTVAVPAMPA